MEAEAERLDGVIAAANTAQRNADDLGERARRAKSAIEELREALLPVYADRSAAYRQMRQFRETHTNYELHTALRKAPEQFGALKAKTVYPLWGLGVVPRPDWTEARDKAPGIAAPLDAYITALPRRPKPEEVEAAKAEADNLRWPGRQAQTARLKLPQSFTYEGEVSKLMRPLVGLATQLVVADRVGVTIGSDFVLGFDPDHPCGTGPRPWPWPRSGCWGRFGGGFVYRF